MDQIKNEQAILGMLVRDSNLLFQYSINIEDFEYNDHKIIFQVIQNINDSKVEVNVMSITAYLVEKNLYSKIVNNDAVEYITAITEQIFTLTNFSYHYEILKKNRKRRDLFSLAQTILKEAEKGREVSVENIIDSTQKKLIEIGSAVKTGVRNLKEINEKSVEELQNKIINKVNYNGLDTGYKQINNIISGFVKTQVIVLAARPAVGKTSLALNLAVAAAQKNKENIMLFSLEMSSQELYTRMLAFSSNIELYKYKYGKLSNEELTRDSNVRNDLTRLNIFINDNAVMKVKDIKNDVYRLEREKSKVGLVIIDYLQLIDGERAESKYAQVSQISRELKQLAKDLNVCVLVLSQLNREVENRKGKKPQLSDLRDSGAIEQDADIVGLLHVDQVEKSDNTDIILLNIAKNRHGQTGEIPLFFHKPTNQFYE